MNAVSNTNIDVKRANKLTAFWAGEGVAIATFYKTHEKLLVVRSDSPEVVGNGFVMPEGTPATETEAEIIVTPQMRLEAFKNFVALNSNLFGIMYDPIDRRADQFKFPNKYDDQLFQEYSRKMLENTLAEVVASVQVNVLDKMIAGEHIPTDSVLATAIDEGVVSVSERYGSGSIKYGVAEYPVTLSIESLGAERTVVATINMVSGQLKKPREFGEFAFTMTGVKGCLIEGGVLPKIEKKKEEDPADADTTGEAEVEVVESTEE